MGSIRNVDWAAASNVGVQVFQQVYRNQFRIFHESPGSPRIKKICSLILSLYTFKPAEAHTIRTRRNLTTIRPGLYIFWDKLASPRQNILSAIKVMKGRVSKKKKEKREAEQQEDEY